MGVMRSLAHVELTSGDWPFDRRKANDVWRAIEWIDSLPDEPTPKPKKP